MIRTRNCRSLNSRRPTSERDRVRNGKNSHTASVRLVHSMPHAHTISKLSKDGLTRTPTPPLQHACTKIAMHQDRVPSPSAGCDASRFCLVLASTEKLNTSVWA